MILLLEFYYLVHDGINYSVLDVYVKFKAHAVYLTAAAFLFGLCVSNPEIKSLFLCVCVCVSLDSIPSISFMVPMTTNVPGSQEERD